MENKIKSLNIGKTGSFDWKGIKESSAIGKASIGEAYLNKAGFMGDGVANLEHHGGPDRAVCLYPYEHYSRWEAEFNTKLTIPAFGENITISGMLEEHVCIGDIFRADEALIQVTQGRVPCSTISKFNSLDMLLDRVYKTGYTGYFFRVIEEGLITAGSNVKLIDREDHGLSVLRANHIFFHERKNVTDMEKMFEIPSLAAVWKAELARRLNSLKN